MSKIVKRSTSRKILYNHFSKGEKMTIKKWIKSLLLLPATIAHELMHTIFVILTFSRITHFSIFPKIIQNKNGSQTLEFGSVGFIPKIKAFNFIIGLAPMWLWAIAWKLLEYKGVIIPLRESFTLDTNTLFSDNDIWWLSIVLFWLIWGGFPSSVDYKTSIKGFLSVSGLFLFIIFGIFFFYHQELTALLHQSGFRINI
jgi:hypothetical protein